MSADFEGNDKDAVVTQQVLDVIDSYGFKKEGAYNLRLNGLAVCHGDSRHIKIVPKEDRQGIDIYISGEAKEEQVHIPVVMTEEGVDIVYRRRSRCNDYRRMRNPRGRVFGNPS